MTDQTSTITIDGIPVPINGSKSILELTRQAGIDLPTFCYHSELSVYGACRMCLIEDEKAGLLAACSTPPRPGMVIKTTSPRIQRIRRTILELLLANHERECTSCEKSGACKLQDLAQRFGVRRVRFGHRDKQLPIDDSSSGLVRNPNKCILCGDCVRMCSEVQGIGALDFAFRGSRVQVMPAFGKALGEVECVTCGQCAAVCPTAALTVKSEMEEVWKALRDDSKVTVIQIAPAVRTAIGECFGKEPGEISTGKLVAALKRLGFDWVFDTSFTADLTTVEETDEILTRLQTNSRLPIFTSCCPAWVRFAEQYFPGKLDQLSTCRSPQQMFGSLMKRHYARELGVRAKDVFVVSAMPCTAKKFEARRPEFAEGGRRDVDAVLSTQELGQMIRETGLIFDELEEEAFDLPFGFATGAGVIFGASAGVTEAVLRAAHYITTGSSKPLGPVAFAPARDLPNVREVRVNLEGRELRAAVVSGLGAARRLLEAMDAGEASYDVVEVMACPGGCVGGGGQPYPNDTPARDSRRRGLQAGDKRQQIRNALENPMVQALYARWLGKPNSHLAHRALHTTYSPHCEWTLGSNGHQSEELAADTEPATSTSG